MKPARSLIMMSAALLLVGCSISEAGQPRAADTGAASTGESDTQPPGSSTEVSPLAEVDPCELLSASDVAELGVSPGEEGDIMGNPSCYWKKTDDFSFTIGLIPDLGIADSALQNQSPVPVNVGTREAYQIAKDGDGDCGLYLVTSQTSFVQILTSASGGRDTPKACGVAVRVAEIIDPKLP